MLTEAVPFWRGFISAASEGWYIFKSHPETCLPWIHQCCPDQAYQAVGQLTNPGASGWSGLGFYLLSCEQVHPKAVCRQDIHCWHNGSSLYLPLSPQSALFIPQFMPRSLEPTWLGLLEPSLNGVIHGFNLSKAGYHSWDHGKGQGQWTGAGLRRTGQQPAQHPTPTPSGPGPGSSGLPKPSLWMRGVPSPPQG